MPFGRSSYEQEFLLNVGCQIEECEYLGGAGRCDLRVAGEFGLVGGLAGAEEFVAVDGHRHEAAEAGDFALRSIGSGAGAELLTAVAAAGGVEVAGDGEEHGEWSEGSGG